GEVMGLQFEPGFVYELQVQADIKSKPAEDGPAIQWVLYRIINKTPATEETDIPATLVGSNWILIQFGSVQTPTVVIGDSEPNLFFQVDGHFTGSTGCNRFNGIYTIEGDRIHLSSIASTRKMCPTPTGMLEQEQSVLKTLELAERYQLAGDQLSIFSEGDSRVITYKK
ncbi:MAG TPA: META domain-containing protein, partial [Leptolinea sp.]